MDCLPADEDGGPLSAARDLNLLGWASRIPSTGFPVLLAGSFMWFPSHKASAQGLRRHPPAGLRLPLFY